MLLKCMQNVMAARSIAKNTLYAANDPSKTKAYVPDPTKNMPRCLETFFAPHELEACTMSVDFGH